MTEPILQAHIHLSTTIGSAPENAPNLTWKVTHQEEVPVVFVSLKRSLKGNLRAGAVRSGGNVLQLRNYGYTVKVIADDTYTVHQRKELLKGLFGQTVYLVPHWHCNDGVDHTEFVRTMFCSRVAVFGTDMPGLQFYYVDIELEDASY